MAELEINTPDDVITCITVSGFKSLAEETTLQVRPLTILAGANSSGKSSMIQPLLLLKQTLEARYDPGALMIDGPIVSFTLAEQLFSRILGKTAESIRISIVRSNLRVDLEFTKKLKGGFDIAQMAVQGIQFRTDMRSDQVKAQIEQLVAKHMDKASAQFLSSFILQPDRTFEIVRDRCFLEAKGFGRDAGSVTDVLGPYVRQSTSFIPHLIQVPGLRGNPQRDYPISAIGGSFFGRFDTYVASVINHWKVENDTRLSQLIDDLRSLGLTWKLDAKPINDTRIELKVGRTPQSRRGGVHDLVSIADVGFGVSQVLPVLVALLTAVRGQIVYIEQPEIHLHPRAQVALARILANAAIRGVRVIAETHSQLLLLGIQTLVAEGELDPKLVGLNWFERREDGSSKHTAADLDRDGAFGDWPEDFAEVELQAENRYLNAADAVHFKK